MWNIFFVGLGELLLLLLLLDAVPELARAGRTRVLRGRF